MDRHGRILPLEPDLVAAKQIDELYRAKHNESHETALQAVYDKGFSDGMIGSLDLIETLQIQIEELKLQATERAPRTMKLVGGDQEVA
jgi:hypothetical protein